MTEQRKLEDALRSWTRAERGTALEAAGLSARGTAEAQVRTLVEGLLEGTVSFAEVLRGVPRKRLAGMARAWGIPLRFSRRDLQARLVEWFDAHFGDRVAVQDEDDVVALAEDDVGDDSALDEVPASAPGYRVPDYATRFAEALRYDPTTARLTPRDYQREAIDTLMAAIRAGRPLALHVATGGGKTWIANDTVMRWLSTNPGWVLWVTKDWRLLQQAARDLGRRHDTMSERLARLGGDGQLLHPLPSMGDRSPRRGTVVYTTLTTLGRRLNAGFGTGFRAPTLVVWDECHWGELAASGKQLQQWCKKRQIPLLGLSATPRSPARSAFQVACSLDFSTLVARGVLAKPIPQRPVATGVHWAPEQDAQLGDFRASSLRELGENTRRNDLVVKHFVDNHRKYGQTLVFACDIDHAERLAQRFKEADVPVGCVHSRRKEEDSNADYDRFRRGELTVLVNVAKLTHGVDLPQVNSVFLCRPTMSDMLFSQMVGRGSRRDAASGKTSFHIVEFTDNLSRFGEQLCTAKAFFEGTSPSTTGTPVTDRVRPDRRGPALAQHGFDPTGRAVWIPNSDEIGAELRGLWVREGQTFGIEFEMTSDAWHAEMPRAEWASVAEVLRQRLESALPGLVAPKVFADYGSARDFHLWNVERDGSCGWEVTSRILRGPEGFREVVDACAALSSAAAELGLRVNHTTGTHVHLGWKDEDVAVLRRAIELVKVFEPAVATLVSPSRIAHYKNGVYDLSRPNDYCAPIAVVFPRARLERASTRESLLRTVAEDSNRYVTFNIKPLDNKGTVEVRLHNGTLDAGKILLWVSLWQQILRAAEQDLAVERAEDRAVIEPVGDIRALAARYLPAVQQMVFLSRLDERRREVAALWGQREELKGWASYADRWSPRV